MQNLLLLLAFFHCDESIISTWNQTGKERWEYTSIHEDKRDELAPIFEAMGLISEIAPQHTHYDYALIIGATKPSIEKRIAYLEQCLQTITIDNIVFLTGMRPLQPHEGIGTEYEMTRKLTAHLPASFICAPMQGTKRPGTVETLALWLESNPTPGRCLVITSQPFVPFHSAMLESVLSFPFEVVGPKASENWTVTLMLDTIAKVIVAQDKKTIGTIQR